MILTVIALLAAAAAAQQPPETPKAEVAVLKADLGPCSADFIVKDAEGKPVYAAAIHVRMRYGAMGVKRMDLEVGTNVDGTARVEGLPTKARLLTYDIQKAGTKATVEQNLADSCHAKFERTLK
jgi:hypothetical protein